MIERISLKMQAYNYLREQIVEGMLSTSELYTELGFAEKLNISRTPVREAVLQLEQEGFVAIRPNKGFVIRSYTENEIRDYLQVRKAIEGFCATETVKSKDSEKWLEMIKDLEKHINEEKQLLNEKADVSVFIKNDTDFHLVIVGYCGNVQMKNIMNDMKNRINRIGTESLKIEGRKQETLNEHKEIVRAIKSGNKQRIYNAYNHHFDMCMKAIEAWNSIKNKF